MKVILQKDVKKIGKKGEVVEVAEGYGRNYLLPRGLAVEASAGNMRQVDQRKQAESKKAERELRDAQKMEKALQRDALTVQAKVGEGGKLFGSITTQEITDQLRKQFSVEIDKRKVELKEPIKSLGEHSAVVKVHPKVHVPITVKVVAE